MIKTMPLRVPVNIWKLVRKRARRNRRTTQAELSWLVALGAKADDQFYNGKNVLADGLSKQGANAPAEGC